METPHIKIYHVTYTSKMISTDTSKMISIPRKHKIPPNSGLILVDIQNDFINGTMNISNCPSPYLFKGETYEKFFSIDFARDRRFGPNKQFYERKSTCGRFLGTPDFLKKFLHQGYYLVVFRVFE